jgi:hypothetical protein
VLIVVVMKREDRDGIDERSFRFFVDVLAFVDTIPLGPKTNKLVEQLAAAAGSIGGNREEALGGSSRKEFIRFNEVWLRGANESVLTPTPGPVPSPLPFAVCPLIFVGSRRVIIGDHAYAE